MHTGMIIYHKFSAQLNVFLGLGIGPLMINMQPNEMGNKRHPVPTAVLGAWCLGAMV